MSAMPGPASAPPRDASPFAPWRDGELRSPVTGARLTPGLHDLHAPDLHAPGPHTPGRHAPAERWPVIDGIAFLRADRRALADAALAALDAGDPETACALLLADQDNWASTPPPDEAACRAVVRNRATLSLRDAMDRLAFGPVGTYFAHRWSDPTFLSGLALAEAHWHRPARVFELACGAGHFLRAFAGQPGVAEVTGADLVFAKLWLARHFVAPSARLLCFDAARPWPLPDASAGLVFCHDALYFLPGKPHVAAEMQRVAGPGRILVGHAHNAAVENLSHGAPLRPAEYAALFGHALLYDDQELTRALVESRAPRPATPEALLAAPAIAVAAATAATDIPRPATAGLAMPARGTPLRRNPLYDDAQDALSAPSAITDDPPGSTPAPDLTPAPDPASRPVPRRFPSPRYEAEYAALATYPETSTAPAHARAGDPGTDAMTRRRELLDLPPAW